MKAFSTWQVAGIGLGLFWSLLYSALLSKVTIVQRLELGVQDSLIRLHKPSVPPNEILLVAVDQSSARPKHTFYADLINHLIANGAKVVVLNLPNSLRRPLDSNLEDPIKEIVKNNSNQVVLVVYTNRQFNLNPSALSIYYHLLPFSDRKITPLVSPEQIHGFFEYEPNLKDLASPARQAYLARNFFYVEDFHKTHELKSVAVLALEKFSQPLWNKVRSQVVLHGQTSLTQSTVQINFWEPAHMFSQIDVKSLCIASLTFDRCVVSPNALDAQTVRNKIVLIDLPREYLDTFGILSPFGNRMSVAEVQASLVASLMTNSFRTTMPAWCDYTITTLGATFISWLIATQMAKSNSYSFRNIWFLLSVVGVYTSLSLLFSWHRLILPLTVPVLTWLVTGVTVAICLLFWQKQQQLAQQQRKLAERQAILSQARKLLHRVASDIHDGPLQELKLVMDGIELLAVNNPTINPNPLLDRLEAVGRDLRDRLRNTRTMAEKLEITPELQSGLDKGIRQHLQQIVSSGELTLKVEDRLQPLLELESDSTWIDAREDIFRFFKEAIANVIRHAQPPNGTATRVTVSLVSQGIQCTLSVENDAIQPDPPTLESTSRRKHSGGYGTKLMATVAAELPGGYWERIPLVDGGMQVILTWTLDATAQDKTEDY